MIFVKLTPSIAPGESVSDLPAEHYFRVKYIEQMYRQEDCTIILLTSGRRYTVVETPEKILEMWGE